MPIKEICMHISTVYFVKWNVYISNSFILDVKIELWAVKNSVKRAVVQCVNPVRSVCLPCQRLLDSFENTNHRLNSKHAPAHSLTGVNPQAAGYQ